MIERQWISYSMVWFFIHPIIIHNRVVIIHFLCTNNANFSYALHINNLHDINHIAFIGYQLRFNVECNKHTFSYCTVCFLKNINSACTIWPHNTFRHIWHSKWSIGLRSVILTLKEGFHQKFKTQNKYWWIYNYCLSLFYKGGQYVPPPFLS